MVRDSGTTIIIVTVAFERQRLVCDHLQSVAIFEATSVHKVGLLSLSHLLPSHRNSLLTFRVQPEPQRF